MEAVVNFEILSWVIGSVLAIIGIWVTVRKTQPGEITYVRGEYIALFDSIVKNMPELEVYCEKRPVTAGLVLLKGALINSGTIDIEPSMVESPLKLSLPTHFALRIARILETSPNLDASIVKSGEEIILNIGLFRINEFIRFEALAESQSQLPSLKDSTKPFYSRSDKLFTFSHRIANTKAVKVIAVLSSKYYRAKDDFKQFRVYSVIAAIILLCGVAWQWNGTGDQFWKVTAVFSFLFALTLIATFTEWWSLRRMEPLRKALGME